MTKQTKLGNKIFGVLLYLHHRPEKHINSQKWVVWAKLSKKLRKSVLECCFWFVLSRAKEFFEKLFFVYILWFFVIFQHFIYFDIFMSKKVDVYLLWAIFLDQMRKLSKHISQHLLKFISLLNFGILSCFLACCVNKAKHQKFYCLIWFVWSFGVALSW